MEIVFTQFSNKNQLSPILIKNLYDFDRLFFATPWTEEAWQSFIASQNFEIILAQSSSEITGMILLNTSVVDSFAHLLKICVSPSCRNKKIGERLMGLAIEALRKNGLCNFYLEVEETNIPALRLYEKFNFNQIHSKKNFYGTNRNAIIMELKR